MAIPEQMFMFKHVDPRRTREENARRDFHSVSKYHAQGWVARCEDADRIHFERSEQDRARALAAMRLARKPKPVRKPKPKPPRKGY